MKTVSTYVHLMFRSVFSVTEACLSVCLSVTWASSTVPATWLPDLQVTGHRAALSLYGAFAQLRKATVKRHVRPSAWNSASTGRICM